MKIGSIYKATCKINGKSYIGFDSSWPHRKSKHKSLAQKGDLKYHFYNAINKYGFDNFEWEVLYQSKDLDHCKNVMEKFFILEFHTYENGYNSTLGGEGTFGHIKSEEAIEKIKNSNKGRIPWNKGKKLEPLSEIHRQKLSESLKGKKAWNKGIPNTEEQKNKISASLKNNNPMNNLNNRLKVSEALKGRKFSDESKKKMSESAKNRKKVIK